jgi:hypothetical protein
LKQDRWRVKVKTRVPEKRSRRRPAWLLGVAVLVFVLLYWELSGLLYVFSTLAISVLFIVVAFSDLKKEHNEVGQGGKSDESINRL